MLVNNNLPINIIARVVTDIKVSNSSFAFLNMMDLAKNYQEKYSKTPISEIPGIQLTRSFFRTIGIDPTRRRPSSEALLRRAVNGKELYQINNIVDVGNWCSLEFLLPICLYDYDKIQGRIKVKIGNQHDSYLAHNGREMNFEDKFVICDEFGAFGSPLTDSLRTAVTEATNRVLMIIFAPEDYDDQLLNRQMDLMEGRIRKLRIENLTQIMQ